MELVWKNLLELGFRFKNISPRSIFLIKKRNTMNKSIICFKKEFINRCRNPDPACINNKKFILHSLIIVY